MVCQQDTHGTRSLPTSTNLRATRRTCGLPQLGHCKPPAARRQSGQSISSLNGDKSLVNFDPFAPLVRKGAEGVFKQNDLQSPASLLSIPVVSSNRKNQHSRYSL